MHSTGDVSGDVKGRRTGENSPLPCSKFGVVSKNQFCIFHKEARVQSWLFEKQSIKIKFTYIFDFSVIGI